MHKYRKPWFLPYTRTSPLPSLSRILTWYDIPMNTLIVANGPFLSRDIITEAAENRTIIALDGACGHLRKLGILPNIILGDFDSTSQADMQYFGITLGFEDLAENLAPYPGKEGCLIVPAKDQNFTDLVKAIRYFDATCKILANFSITIVCATGGRMDLTLSNLRALRSQYNPKRPIILLTESERIQFIKDDEITLQGNVGDYCGVMAFPMGSFSSEGLKYNGKDSPLNFAYQESACNQLISPTAHIRVKGEALIIGPGQLKSQQRAKPTSASFTA